MEPETRVILLEDGGGAGAREYQECLITGKGKNIDLLMEPSEEMQPCQTFDFRL